MMRPATRFVGDLTEHDGFKEIFSAVFTAELTAPLLESQHLMTEGHRYENIYCSVAPAGYDPPTMGCPAPGSHPSG